MKYRGFSIAECMTVMGIIGVLATLVVPALIHNKNQSRFITGFKKGVTLINNAISMSVSNGRGSALKTTEDNPLYLYLQNDLKIIKKAETSLRNSSHSEFYTPDGMRFEFPKSSIGSNDEFSNLTLGGEELTPKGYNCGTKGLDNSGSIKARKKEPCIVLLDVNGDEGPNKLTNDTEKTISDMFLILVTDKTAIPYGETAQKVYYGH